MRRFIPIFSGLVLVGLVVLPMIASAQLGATTPSDCCRIKKDITISGATTYDGSTGNERTGDNAGKCMKGEVVGWQEGVENPGDMKCTLKGREVDIDCPTIDWGNFCLLNTIINITDWIFYIFVTLTMIMAIWAGILFMTAGGDATKIEKARGMVIYIVIGIAIAIAAKIIPGIVGGIIGG